MNKTSAIWSIGFRPFFINVALIAIINPIIWVLYYGGHIQFDLYNVSALFWHGHEMLFGFTGAMIAGFLLTASANWTNSKPYNGVALIFLVGVWFVERLSYLLPVDKIIFFGLSNIFFPVLMFMLLLKLIKYPKHKYIFIPILLSLTTASLFHTWGHLFSKNAMSLFGIDLATGTIRFIVLLIAGRVIPFFTFKKIGTKIEVSRLLNVVSLVSVALLIVPWNQITGGDYLLIPLLVVAFVSNALRQLQWSPQKTMKIPILFILHIGIIFINLNFIFELVEFYFPQFGIFQASLHLLMAAGVGTVGVGIMTRVSLGHTGRVIRADRWICMVYALVILGGLVRFFGPSFYTSSYISSLVLSATLWSGGFGIFLLRFWTILVTPRPDGR
jgi:uncharacterized protein involved in response to NO